MNPRIPAALLAVAVSLTACSDDGGDGDGQTLRILAASSLTEAFDQLATDFEAGHEGVEVELSYDSSSILAEQIIEGAPADVLASADELTMNRVVAEGLAGDEHPVFVRNYLVLVTPADNPAGIDGIADLDSDEVDYVVCVPEAPCGNAAQTVLGDNDVSASPASEEDTVKSVLEKVTLGEADAGLVYVTDAQAAGDDVQTVEIPGAEQVLNDYPVTVLADAEEPDLGQEWIDLLLSEEGQQVLVAAGFTPAT